MLDHALRSLARRVVLSFTALAMVLAKPASSAAPCETLARYVPGQVVVQYKPSANAMRQQAIPRRLGVTVHSTVRLPRTFVYRVGSQSVEQAVAAFRNDPDVEFAEPNYLYYPTSIPNDPGFANQYALYNYGQTGGTPGADIGAKRAWDVTTGSDSIIVAILDSGTAWDHQDLADNIWINPGEGTTPDSVDNDHNGKVDDIHGWDFVGTIVHQVEDNDPKSYNTDQYSTHGWHGTHVAGIVGAVGNNSLGGTGVAWNVSLLPCKLYYDDDEGPECAAFTTSAVAAIDYAIEVHARVINASWGGCDSSEALRQAIERAGEAGIVFVTAAGNWKTDIDAHPFYPASYSLSNIVVVAASDKNDAPWAEPIVTAFGTSYGHHTVDLAAPGMAIYSTVPGGYQNQSGSSMAAPQVAGAFALMFSHLPNLTAQQAIDRMLQYVDPVEGWEDLTVTGGRLNIGRAILGEDTAPPDTVTDLVAATISSNWVKLRWTSPVDNGFLQRAITYDLRRSTSPINAGDFSSATPVSGLPVPSAGGALDSVVAGGLTTSTQYYFALKATDEASNTSVISNVVSATTLGPPTASESPNPVTATVLTGATTNVSFKLKNSGGGGLDYSVAAPNVGWAVHNFGSASSTGTLFASDSVQWLVHMDALARPAGLNSGSFVITTNDPNHTSITVNLQMTVTSAPDVAVRPGSYDFGAIFVGSSRAKTFQISNPGTQTLSVSTIGTSHGDYDASVSSLTIAPGDSGAVEVVFAPSSTSTGNATLDLTTNDPDEGTVHINLLGDVLDVSVSPVAVTDTICTGERAVHEVTVTNNSAVSVAYQVRSAAGSTPALSQEGSDPPLTGLRVLFHTPHSNTLGGYTALITDLQARGAEVVDSDSSLTAEMLRAYHIFWLPLSYASWTAAERSAVAHWVQGGGTLLVTAIGPYESNFDPLADSLGAHLNLTTDFTSRDQADGFATHPITNGIDELVTGTTFGHLTVGSPSLPLVFDGGDTLGAYAQIGAGRLVALAGDYFTGSGPYDAINSGDNLQFARQAFDWLADAVWLASSPMSGTIASSAHADLDVTMDGKQLAAGTRSRDLVVQVTSPDTKTFVVPMTLKTGIPDILPPGNINYGNVPQMTSSTKTAKVKNTGTCALEVTAMDLSAYFTWAGPGSSFSPVSIAPGDSFIATIRFTPEYQGFHYGTLTIISNDPDANEDTVTVNLQGKGFGYQYAAGQAGPPREVVIKNSGAADLRWQLIGARTEAPPVADYALSNTSTPVITKRGADDADGLRDLASARIALSGPMSTLSRDLTARGAKLTKIERPLKNLTGFNALWLAGDVSLQDVERGVVANWVRNGGALLVEGSLSLDGLATEGAIGSASAQAASAGAADRFGEWLQLGTGAIIRLAPGAASDAAMEDRSVRLAANKAVDWLIPADWIEFDNASGMTSPGATTKVGVRKGSVTLPAGTHLIEVTAYTSNSDQPWISIPVQMTIGPIEEIARPTIHALRQSAPNPMLNGTRIAFDLPVEEHVSLEVFDVNGRSVRTLVDKLMPAGVHHVDWNGQAAGGRRVAAGVYFYRIKTPTFNAVKKLVVAQ